MRLQNLKQVIRLKGFREPTRSMPDAEHCSVNVHVGVAHLTKRAKPPIGFIRRSARQLFEGAAVPDGCVGE